MKEINVRRGRENCERLGSPREGKGSLFRNSYYSGLREPSVFRETKKWAGDEKCEMLEKGEGSVERGPGEEERCLALRNFNNVETQLFL